MVVPRRGRQSDLFTSRSPLKIAAIVAMACAQLGCMRPRTDTELDIPVWTAEVPTGAAPREIRLPARFDNALPRAPSEYVLRTNVALPDTMRGRPLTLVLKNVPALATLRVDG